MLLRALLFRSEEGTQGGREGSGDVRGSRGEAGESLGAEHVCAILKVLARVRLGRSATFLILPFPTFSFRVVDEYAGGARRFWRRVHDRM